MKIFWYIAALIIVAAVGLFFIEQSISIALLTLLVLIFLLTLVYRFSQWLANKFSNSLAAGFMAFLSSLVGIVLIAYIFERGPILLGIASGYEGGAFGGILFMISIPIGLIFSAISGTNAVIKKSK